MSGRLRQSPFRLYGRLPARVRSLLVKLGTPSYHVGALAFLARPDGTLLLVRDVYRAGWGLPGGLLRRGEAPAEGVRRELAEELGVIIEVDPSPTVVVDPPARRVDLVFRAHAVAGQTIDALVPTSAELVEARWFPAGSLPPLQRETEMALSELARRDGAGGAGRAVPAGP